MKILAEKTILNPLQWQRNDVPVVKAVLTVGGLGTATGNFRGDLAVYFDRPDYDVETISKHGHKMRAAEAVRTFPEVIIDESFYRY